MSELAEWWRKMSDIEIERTVPKATEYGADDLVEIGQQLARMSGREVEAHEAAELGVIFYACGKMARIMAAVREGRWPSEDTWFDLGVYSRMAQRIRQAGSWPGTAGAAPRLDKIRDGDWA